MEGEGGAGVGGGGAGMELGLTGSLRSVAFPLICCSVVSLRASEEEMPSAPCLVRKSAISFS